MRNWSTDIDKLKKYPEKYELWKLEQLINFGLNGEKIPVSQLKKYFTKLSIDSKKRAYLRFLFS